MHRPHFRYVPVSLALFLRFLAVSLQVNKDVLRLAQTFELHGLQEIVGGKNVWEVDDERQAMEDAQKDNQGDGRQMQQLQSSSLQCLHYEALAEHRLIQGLDTSNVVRG